MHTLHDALPILCGECATVAEFTAGLRDMKTKGGKVAALKDNIRIRWNGIGWVECETRWTVDGQELTIPELAN